MVRGGRDGRKKVSLYPSGPNAFISIGGSSVQETQSRLLQHLVILWGLYRISKGI